MNYRTVTVTLPARAEEVFEFLSDVDNLPSWATDFAQELKIVDGNHKIVNGLGEFFFRIEADPRTGVIDMLAGPSLENMALFPTRVVDTAEGSAFTFTMFQSAEVPFDVFEGQYWSLLHEMNTLRHRFGAAT